MAGNSRRRLHELVMVDALPQEESVDKKVELLKLRKNCAMPIIQASRHPGVCSNLAAGLKRTKKRRSKGEALALFQSEPKTWVGELFHPAKNGELESKEIKKQGKAKDGTATVQSELLLAKAPNLSVQCQIKLEVGEEVSEAKKQRKKEAAAVQCELKLEAEDGVTPALDSDKNFGEAKKKRKNTAAALFGLEMGVSGTSAAIRIGSEFKRKKIKNEAGAAESHSEQKDATEVKENVGPASLLEADGKDICDDNAAEEARIVEELGAAKDSKFSMKEEYAEMSSEVKVKVNVITGSNPEEERVVKKRKLYKEDKLMLVCEWDGCGEEQANPDVFTWHVGQHCNDAEVNIVFSFNQMDCREEVC